MWKPSCLPTLLPSFQHMHEAVPLAASNHSFDVLEEQRARLCYQNLARELGGEAGGLEKLGEYRNVKLIGDHC